MSNCVNALYRAHSISTQPSPATVSSMMVCQCPVSGVLHFYYIEVTPELYEQGMCQCPISGVLHFYRKGEMKMNRKLKKCQCPISGVLHFYDTKHLWTWNTSCVNALYRAYSISTLSSRWRTATRLETVSMPCIGRTPFLPCLLKALIL